LLAAEEGKLAVLWAAIVLDLTEREAFRTELRQPPGTEVGSRPADRMTHDLNVLIAVVISKLERVRTLDPGDQRISELVAEALEAALRCEFCASIDGHPPQAANASSAHRTDQKRAA
jgi:hypothetical protein